MAVLIIEDLDLLVSRKWLTEIVSVEQTHTQVELAFTAALTAALAAEGLLERVEARHTDGLVDTRVDDEHRPILLAVSDNGPQTTSGDLGADPGVPGAGRARQQASTSAGPAPRPTRPGSGLDREPQRAPQGRAERVPAPARDR